MRDTFRKKCRPLTDQDKETIFNMKETAEKLELAFLAIEGLYETSLDQRAMAIAKTNLEQAVMWATKAITA